MDTFLDLTRDISENIAVYPGDPEFKRDLLSVAKAGDKSSFTLYHLHFGNHTGTHIDFPAHIIPQGKTSSDYLLSDLQGSGCVIEFPFTEISGIKAHDIVFFKTTHKPAHLNIEMAEQLSTLGVKIVGTDQMSIDAPDADNFPVHHYLLSGDILIVEGLYLEKIQPGRAEFIIAPLKINYMDGLPVRVMGRRI